jgi:hypothetical protein
MHLLLRVLMKSFFRVAAIQILGFQSDFHTWNYRMQDVAYNLVHATFNMQHKT